MFTNGREDTNGNIQLPPGWEQAFDVGSNKYFYVDHNTKTTTWLNPHDRWTKPKSVNECHNDQLPYGWERVDDPSIGVYYIDHINKRNQWSNPVSDYLNAQNQYSNSRQILSLRRSGNSLGSNAHTISPTTTITTGKQESSSTHASDIEKSATSLNNSTNLSTEIIRSNSSTRGSRFNASLLDIMDNRFGRESSQSVEV